jgi:hypothetical protein
MTYFRNIKLFLLGFRWFDRLKFRAGWSADSWKWRLLYWIDYGSHTLSGGAVVSWSRWFYDKIDSNNDRAIERFEALSKQMTDQHGVLMEYVVALTGKVGGK